MKDEYPYPVIIYDILLLNYFLLLILLIIIFVEYEPKIAYHPKSYYTSRNINYSTKLNEYIAQDYSDKIFILDHYTNDYDDKDGIRIISENLGTYSAIINKYFV